MRHRDQPIEVPRRRPYFRVIVGDRELAFRVPRPSSLERVSRVLRRQAGEDSAQTAEASEEAQGVVLGAYWADGTMALESDPSDGLFVWGEVYDAGFSVQEIRAIYMALLEVTAQLSSEEAVRATVDFSWARVPATTAPSTSETDTSVICGDSSG
jgi:hypothetical protein